MTTIENILRDKYGKDIFIPEKFMQTEILQNLEKGLRAWDPDLIERTLNKELANLFDDEYLNDFQTDLENFEYENKLNKADEEIIEFLAKNSGMDPGYFLRITASLSNAIDTTEEIDSSTPPNIKASAYMWNYIYMYENLLDLITRTLVEHYDRIDSERKSDLNEKLARGEHLMAGETKDEINSIGEIDCNCKNSLLFDEAKGLRNSLGHANLHYDSEANQIVFKSGKRQDFEGFCEEFELLLAFATYWIFKMNDDSLEVIPEIRGNFGSMRDLIDKRFSNRRDEVQEFVQEYVE